jgi:plastocyanin
MMKGRESLLMTLFLALAQLTAGGAELRSLSGTVRYEADPNAPWRFQRYYVADPTMGLLAEAVVALKPAGPFPQTFPNPGAEVVVDQVNFQFVPETVAVRTGQKVVFTNSDDSLHNVMLIHPKEAFNVNLGKGETYEHTFHVPVETFKPHRLGCVYHGSMRGWVFVFDHPFFALTGKDGSFQLKGIPIGKYELEVHHPAGRLKITQPIEIKSDDSPSISVTLSPKNQ